jgi:hypothetical protein
MVPLETALLVCTGKTPNPADFKKENTLMGASKKCIPLHVASRLDIKKKICVVQEWLPNVAAWLHDGLQ